MSAAVASMAAIVVGAALLLLGAGSVDSARAAAWKVRMQRWLTIGGVVLLTAGIGMRIAWLAPEVGACPFTSGLPASAHCFHGAPWPPHGSSR